MEDNTNLSDGMKEIIKSVGHKVHTVETGLPLLQKLKAEGKKIVQCDGVFDLVHPGHIEYFSEARGHGDILVVAIVGDVFVRKGPGRPIFDEKTRALWLASLVPVDYVIINQDVGPQNILEALKPNVLVKGSEYIEKPTEGFLKNKATVEEGGGRVEFVKELAHSSEILKKIYSLF